jgi:hypothetical protein
MNWLTTKYFISKYDYSSAMKAGAFLAAMKRGAVVIFHAHPGLHFILQLIPENKCLVFFQA